MGSSDSSLLFLAIVAVVVAAVALLLQFNVLSQFSSVLLQPAESESGTAAVEITSNLDIIIVPPTTKDWGAGSVDAGSVNYLPDPVTDVGASGAALDTLAGAVEEDAWTGPGVTPVGSGFVIRNVGNEIADLYIRAQNDIDNFLTGGAGLSGDSEQYYSFVVNSGSLLATCPIVDRCPSGCTWGQGLEDGTNWNQLPVSSDGGSTDFGDFVCDGFDFNSGQNELLMDVLLFIDGTVPPTGGQVTNTIFVSAEIS